jgi:outer membrane protein
MRQITYAVFTALATTVALPAHADMVGVYASADYWQYDGQADVAQTGKDKESFTFDQQKQAAVSLSFEHPVPLIPNVRLRHTALKGTDTINSVLFNFDNKVYTGDVDLDLDFTTTDMILYYEILDNIVSVDVGLAAKQVDGDVTVRGHVAGLAQTSTVALKEIIPMAYVSAGGSLPFTGFSFKAEAAGVTYDGSSITDAQAEVKYDLIDNLLVDVGIKAGYRQLLIELEDIEKTDAKLDFKGPYLGVEIHF